MHLRLGQKKRPKVIITLRRVKLTRGTTQIAAKSHLLSGPVSPYALTQQSRGGSTCKMLSSSRLGSYKHKSCSYGLHQTPILCVRKLCAQGHTDVHSSSMPLNICFIYSNTDFISRQEFCKNFSIYAEAYGKCVLRAPEKTHEFTYCL